MKGEQQEVAQTSYSPVVSYYITASRSYWARTRLKTKNCPRNCMVTVEVLGLRPQHTILERHSSTHNSPLDVFKTVWFSPCLISLNCD